MYEVEELDYPIESTRSIQTPYGEQDENGTDLSLIRSSLDRSPTERLLVMDEACRGVIQLFEHGRKHRQEPPPAHR
jgi:hypothetical protein